MRKIGVVVLAAIGVTLIVGIFILLGVFLLNRRDQPYNVPEWQDPINLVDFGGIDPALAVAGLGGVSDSDLVAQALAEGRTDTAFAILVFSPSIGSRESAGDFLLLANRYRNDNQPQNAMESYRLAGTIATLSPDLPDTVRAETFVLAGEGMTELNEYGLAQLYFDQAYNVVVSSSYLQAATRRSLLQRLHQGYLKIGDKERARASLDQSAEDFPTVAIPDPPPVLPVAEPPPLPIEVQEAEANRWLAAQNLAVALIERGGKAREEDVIEISNALLLEDQLRLPYFDSHLAETAQLSTQISIVQARIDWLSIKYRVARGGYGISLVPEWETDAEQIRAELTKSYELLYALYADLIVAMPDADQIDIASEEVLRREILAGVLGRYPNYPAEQRNAQLLEATAQLVETDPNAEMRVVILPYAGVDSYLLVDDASFVAITQE